MKITKETRTKRPVKKMNAGNRLKRVALALLVVWLLQFAFDTWRIWYTLRFALADVRLFRLLVLPVLYELTDTGTLYAIGVILDRVITSRNEKERILYLLEGKTAPGPDKSTKYTKIRKAGVWMKRAGLALMVLIPLCNLMWLLEESALQAPIDWILLPMALPLYMRTGVILYGLGLIADNVGASRRINGRMLELLEQPPAEDDESAKYPAENASAKRPAE